MSIISFKIENPSTNGVHNCYKILKVLYEQRGSLRHPTFLREGYPCPLLPPWLNVYLQDFALDFTLDLMHIFASNQNLSQSIFTGYLFAE